MANDIGNDLCAKLKTEIESAVAARPQGALTKDVVERVVAKHSIAFRERLSLLIGSCKFEDGAVKIIFTDFDEQPQFLLTVKIGMDRRARRLRRKGI